MKRLIVGLVVIILIWYVRRILQTAQRINSGTYLEIMFSRFWRDSSLSLYCLHCSAVVCGFMHSYSNLITFGRPGFLFCFFFASSSLKASLYDWAQLLFRRSCQGDWGGGRVGVDTGWRPGFVWTADILEPPRWSSGEGFALLKFRSWSVDAKAIPGKEDCGRVLNRER